eukprot:scaffold27685_cov63-Cyclotella_meneghiniana.AAC.7
MDNSAFLSGGQNEEDNFAALDAMAPNPNAFSNYGQQSAPQMSAPSSSEHGFSGGSESLFDRIRARTLEQQKQSSSVNSQPAAPAPSQQHASEPTMELEKSPNSFDAAVAQASSGARTTSNETTYSFSGPSDFSSAIPQVPNYANTHYASADPNHQYPTSMKDKASATFNTLWNGAQTLVSSAQERMKSDQTGGGYSTNFLLREDGMEGGVGAPPAPMGGMAQQTTNNENSEGGAMSFVSGQAYSMLSYGKTFCEDMYGFFLELPRWGKGAVVFVTILLIKFLFFW